MPTRVLREIPHLDSWTDWDNLRQAKAALAQLEMGIMLEGARLWDMMGRDDRIEGCTGQRFHGLLGLPMMFKAADGETVNQPVLDALKADFPKMFPEAQLFELLRWGHGVGIGLGQLTWDTDAETGRLLPRLQVWHPRHLRWDITDERWLLNTRTVSGLQVEGGTGEWLVYAPYGVRRGWMHSLVRALMVPWLFRQWTYRDWGRYSEVYGAPQRKAFMPMGGDEKRKDRWFREVAALGRDSTIRLERSQVAGKEDGYDVELLEATGTGYEGFDKAIARAETSIAVRVNGQNLTTEVKGGSYAAATVHANVRLDLIQFDETTLAGSMRDQVLTRWARVNFGAGTRVPWARWNTKPPETRKTTGEGLEATGKGIKALQETGAKPDVDAILEDQGIPTTGPAGEPPAPAPAAGAAPERERAGVRVPATIRGQAYVDELAEAGATHGAAVLRPDLADVLRVVREAKDYADLRARLLATYRGLSRERLAQVVEKASVLADLDGRFAVLDDL